MLRNGELGDPGETFGLLICGDCRSLLPVPCGQANPTGRSRPCAFSATGSSAIRQDWRGTVGIANRSAFLFLRLTGWFGEGVGSRPFNSLKDIGRDQSQLRNLSADAGEGRWCGYDLFWRLRHAGSLR